MAEKDNAGCYFLDEKKILRLPEVISVSKEFTAENAAHILCEQVLRAYALVLTDKVDVCKNIKIFDAN